MPFVITLPEGYGYSAVIALGVIPVMAFVHGTIVSGKRKAAGVVHPNAYATAEVAKDNKAAHVFNCAQRAHGQFLENMPQTILSILFAGVFYPQSTALLGLSWVVFRALFAYGYIYSDKPAGKGRFIGSGYYLAQGGLWGLCVYAALTQLI